jgi:hypothetical protein
LGRAGICGETKAALPVKDKAAGLAQTRFT